MSTLYPRLVDVHRSKTNATNTSGTQQVGLLGYSGREQSISSSSDPEGEIILYTGLPANIVARQTGRAKTTFIPSDISERQIWQILIPLTALPQYSVRDRDVIVDDEGYRYMVSQNWFTVLGYQLSCFRMEA